MNGQILNGSRMQQPQMVLSKPFNDIQLIAFIAGQIVTNLGSLPDESQRGRIAVTMAMDLLAESATQGAGLPALVRQKQKETPSQP